MVDSLQGLGAVVNRRPDRSVLKYLGAGELVLRKIGELY